MMQDMSYGELGTIMLDMRQLVSDESAPQNVREAAKVVYRRAREIRMGRYTADARR